MSGWGKYVWAALGVAAITHFAIISAIPRLLTGAAITRLGEAGFNQWRVAPRVTAQSRTIVRPAPDFAYAACAYDLEAGPLTIRVAPWRDYWSLSLYAANSDNFFVVDDREARGGAAITLVRAGRRAPDDAAQVIESPSRRGVALIRRLAPTADAYAAAAERAKRDICAPFRPS
jgi:uncharacterized membrane protein